MTKRRTEHLLARHRLRRDRRLVPQARPEDALPQPRHLHRRDRQRRHDGDLLPRPLRVRRQRAALVHGNRRALALAHGSLRELRRGDRRGSWEGAGERPPRHPHHHDGVPALGHRRPRGGACPDLRRGDIVVVEAGQIIPADGEIIEGVGSVDESAITGESHRSSAKPAATARPSPGDPSALRPARDRGHPGAGTVRSSTG